MDTSEMKSDLIPPGSRKRIFQMSKKSQIQQKMAEKHSANPVAVENTPSTEPQPEQPEQTAGNRSLEQIMADNRAKAEVTKQEQYQDKSVNDKNVTSISAGTPTTGERKVSDALRAILEKAAAKHEEKGAAKEESEPKKRGGNRYIIWDETKIRPKLSPQGLFIMTELMNAGENGLTKKELTEKAIAAGQEKFPTNQPHDRAIGFYLSAFKNEGALAFASGPAPAETKSNTTENASTPPVEEVHEELNGEFEEDEDEDENDDEDEEEDE